MRKKNFAARHWLLMIPLALAPLALAQPPDVQIWTSLTSGIKYKLTVSESRLAAEKMFPPEYQPQVDHGAYVRCEYSRQGETWVGECGSKLPFAGAKNRPKWCTFRFASKITSFTPARIEGESEVWDAGDVDVDKCELRKTHMQRFVWVRKVEP